MTKTTLAITVDSKVVEDIRELGINVSGECERRLIELTKDKELQKFKDIPRWLIERVRQHNWTKPEDSEYWATFINKKLGTNITGPELYNYMLRIT